MKKPSISTLKKYLAALGKSKAKYITTERLSRIIGVYPEVICENLAYFEPMILMDTSINILEIVPTIKNYIRDQEEKKTPTVHIDLVTKKTLEGYESINDFVYRKYSVGGLIDKGAELSDKDLRIMKRLITEELAKRRKK